MHVVSMMELWLWDVSYPIAVVASSFQRQKKDISARDPSLVEVVAIRQALEVAGGLGIENLLMFFDALVVIDSLNDIEIFVSLDLIISDCLMIFF